MTMAGSLGVLRFHSARIAAIMALLITGIPCAMAVPPITTMTDGQSSPPHDPPSAADPDAIVAGRNLFREKNCTLCHGADGAGGVPLAGNTLTFDTIRDTIANGRISGGKRMPAWEGVLTKTEIDQLAAYVMSLKVSK